MTHGPDSVPGLLTAISVVDDAIGLAKGALSNYPTLEQSRVLHRTLIRLSGERAILETELDHALEGSEPVQGPSQVQLAKIVALQEEIEKAADKTASVNARIALARSVLAITGSVLAIIGPWPPK